MVNGLRGTAHLFAWQVQHLESLGAACGQRSPRDRALFCVAGAALREPWALYLDKKKLAAPEPFCVLARGHFCVSGAALGTLGATFAWQAQHFVHLELLLRGRRNTLTPSGLPWSFFRVAGGTPAAFAWQAQHFVQMGVAGAAL